MTIDKVQPSFGAMKYKEPQQVGYYMYKHLKNLKQTREYGFIQSKNEFCDVDMYLSVVKGFLGKEQLKVEVGEKSFITGIFKSPLKALKQATKYAFKLSEEREFQVNNLNKK